MTKNIDNSLSYTVIAQALELMCLNGFQNYHKRAFRVREDQIEVNKSLFG